MPIEFLLKTQSVPLIAQHDTKAVQGYWLKLPTELVISLPPAFTLHQEVSYSNSDQSQPYLAG